MLPEELDVVEGPVANKLVGIGGEVAAEHVNNNLLVRKSSGVHTDIGDETVELVAVVTDLAPTAAADVEVIRGARLGVVDGAHSLELAVNGGHLTAVGQLAVEVDGNVALGGDGQGAIVPLVVDLGGRRIKFQARVVIRVPQAIIATRVARPAEPVHNLGLEGAGERVAGGEHGHVGQHFRGGRVDLVGAGPEPCAHGKTAVVGEVARHMGEHEPGPFVELDGAAGNDDVVAALVDHVLVDIRRLPWDWNGHSSILLRGFLVLDPEADHVAALVAGLGLPLEDAAGTRELRPPVVTASVGDLPRGPLRHPLLFAVALGDPDVERAVAGALARGHLPLHGLASGDVEYGVVAGSGAKPPDVTLIGTPLGTLVHPEKGVLVTDDDVHTAEEADLVGIEGEVAHDGVLRATVYIRS
mmetsp:Transcript_37691/g.118984  ORF Transcript_37691/g.118984 Transcript_37691/m.118984 type:complete len:413 (+) Transcript_37691:849-2087(+)